MVGEKFVFKDYGIVSIIVWINLILSECLMEYEKEIQNLTCVR